MSKCEVNNEAIDMSKCEVNKARNEMSKSEVNQEERRKETTCLSLTTKYLDTN
jgi:hypothetical protein